MSESKKVAYAEKSQVDRVKDVLQRLERGECVYPYDFKETSSIKQILAFVSDKAEDYPLSSYATRTGGRVQSIRGHKGLSFIDIASDGHLIQVVVGSAIDVEFSRGDVVGVEGVLGRTQRGALSIMASSLRVLTPCLRVIPPIKTGLKNKESCYRQRYLDLLVNERSREIFRVRHRTVSFLRSFFDQRDFVEVETPMMNQIAGGAAAKPFKTYLNECDMDLTMRISPELFLKTLLVGGYSRVYEMGKLFRNEGIDYSHNPEFTSCEGYASYFDYNDVFTLIEDFVSSLVHHLFNSYVVRYAVEDKEVEINFAAPFKRIDILEGLNRELGTALTGELLELDEGREVLDKLCVAHNVKCAEPRTTSRLLDKLIGEFLEGKCHDPTFLMNHPKIMSPLAKEHRSIRGLTERFELFVRGKEICNAYTELNDPFDQRRRFEQQAKDRVEGDEEAQEFDEGFCYALEYGLPPAAGWGIGIDRLVMMLTGATNIREVLLFPMLKKDEQMSFVGLEEEMRRAEERGEKEKEKASGN